MRREEYAVLRQELNSAMMDLKRKIDSLPRGPVRVPLQRKLSTLTGELVNLRQSEIAESAESETPWHVPRETFGLKV